MNSLHPQQQAADARKTVQLLLRSVFSPDSLTAEYESRESQGGAVEYHLAALRVLGTKGRCRVRPGVNEPTHNPG